MKILRWALPAVVVLATMSWVLLSIFEPSKAPAKYVADVPPNPSSSTAPTEWLDAPLKRFELPKAVQADSRCRKFALAFDNFDYYQKQKHLVLQHLFGQMHDDGLQPQQIDYVAINAGMRWQQGRVLANPSELGLLTREDSQWLNQFASPKQQVMFIRALQSNDSGRVRQALDDGQWSPNLLYVNAEGQLLSATGLVLTSKYLTDDTMRYNWLETLLGLGGKFAYHDLITATQSGNAVELVDFMMSNSDLKANKTFVETYRRDSLATLALYAAQPQLLDYWLKLGSAANPDWFNDNALDSLPVPTNASQLKLYTEMFYLLMARDVVPGSALTYEKLSRWLAQDVLKKYPQLTSVHQARMPASWQTLVDTQVFNLHMNMILNGDVNLLPEKDRKNFKCINFAGRKLVQLVLKKQSSGGSQPSDSGQQQTANSQQPNKVETIATGTDRHKQLLKSAQALITQLQNEGYLPQEVLQALAQRKDLLGKTAYQQHKWSMMEQAIDSLFEQSVANSQQQESQFDQQMRKALFEQNDVATAEQLLGQNDVLDEQRQQQWLSLMLDRALEQNLPFSQIESLLNRGASLNEFSAVRVIAHNNLDTLVRLLPFGLNLKFVDQLGHHGVWHSVRHRADRTLAYLLDHGVGPNTSAAGLDALDMALGQLDFSNGGIAMVTLLLQAGAEVQQSHIERAQSYRSENIAIYEALVSAHPQLAG